MCVVTYINRFNETFSVCVSVMFQITALCIILLYNRVAYKKIAAEI